MRRRDLLATAALAPAARAAEQERFEDATRLSAGQVLEADLCIVGAGAAGITLARELANSGLSILLLEAGGERLEARDQALCRWAQSGQRYFDLATCRLRYFGGTTNHWAGYSTAPLSIDFDARPDLGVAGWPIGLSTLQPYVERAARWLGYPDARFDPAAAAGAYGAPAEELFDARVAELSTRLFRISRKHRFGARHGDALAAQAGLRVVLHASVVHLQLAPSGRTVREARVRSFGGPELRVRAARWVLAAHALENARLLLASNDVVPRGIGNAHDQVGRCFMEHPGLDSGLLIPTPAFPRVYDEQWGSARDCNWTVGAAAPQLLRHRILPHQCRFMPVYAHDRVRLAARRLREHWWRPADAPAWDALGELAAHPADAIGLAAHNFAGLRFEPVAYRLEQRIEQAPNPDSRVELELERDALGMPKARLHWALSELDLRSLAVGQEVLAAAVERLGVGRVEAPPIDAQLVRREVRGLNHHAGTTRMSLDPRDGVVDADCRVHGVDNLYVAGSAVFPRIGMANPTLLIVALAMRLANHLKLEARA